MSSDTEPGLTEQLTAWGDVWKIPKLHLFAGGLAVLTAFFGVLTEGIAVGAQAGVGAALAIYGYVALMMVACVVGRQLQVYLIAASILLLVAWVALSLNVVSGVENPGVLSQQAFSVGFIAMGASATPMMEDIILGWEHGI